MASFSTRRRGPDCVQHWHAEAGRFTATKGFTWTPAFQSAIPAMRRFTGTRKSRERSTTLYNGLQFSVGTPVLLQHSLDQQHRRAQANRRHDVDPNRRHYDYTAQGVPSMHLQMFQQAL